MRKKQLSKSDIHNLHAIIATNFLVKFGLSEKHTKFKKKFPHVFYKSADLLSKHQKHKEDFFILCVLHKKSEL